MGRFTSRVPKYRRNQFGRAMLKEIIESLGKACARHVYSLAKSPTFHRHPGPRKSNRCTYSAVWQSPKRSGGTPAESIYRGRRMARTTSAKVHQSITEVSLHDHSKPQSQYEKIFSTKLLARRNSLNKRYLPAAATPKPGRPPTLPRTKFALAPLHSRRRFRLHECDRTRYAHDALTCLKNRMN